MQKRSHWSAILAIVSLGLMAGPRTALAAQTEDENKQPADEATIEEAIVVSANRFEVPASQVGSSVTVIEIDEIEQRNQITVGDLLRTVPGVEFLQTGGPGQTSSLRIRGGSPAQALILIDGLRINTVNNGDVDFANLTADNIERIEVLRGPQATYGSEAMSGVVSIMTRRGAEGWRAKALVEGGSHDHQRFELGVSGASGIFDYSLSAGDLSTDAVSHRVIPGGAVEDDPWENQTFAARLGVAFFEDGRVDLSVRSYQGDTAVDGFGPEDLNAQQTTDGETFVLSVEKSFTSSWRQTFRLGGSRTDILGTDPDIGSFNNFDIRSKNLQFDTQADITLSPSNVLNIGYSSERREGSNLGDFGFDEQADLEAFFVQDQWSPTDKIHLTGAIRYDDHSVFGDETSYRLTAVTSFSDGRTRLHGSAGTAFRAPNFNELYFPFAGDPNLLPEASKGIDIGLHHQLLRNRLNFDLTFFDIDFENLIQFDLGSFLFANVADARSTGAELTIGYRLATSLDLDFSYTYNDTEDRETGEPLPRRPKNRTTLVARFAPTQRLDGAAAITAVRDRIDSTGLDMDDYERLDLTLRYTALPWLKPFVRLDNALDEDYQEVPGFTTPGRVYFAGVTFSRE